MAEPTGPGSSEAARFQFPDGIAPGFAIEGVIGRGAHGIVYRAVQVNLGRPVALKVLRDDALSERSIRDRFLQEARIAASLNHPNIVPVLDHGISQGFAYIAFPLIEGTSLRKFIGKDGVPWAQASSYVHGIATALAYVHSLGIVHRDLKPENVLVNTAGQVVVTDFGISKPQRSALHTEAGVILGTAGYLSPEQIVGGTGSSQSDIYAFGVLIWELLVGCRPFERVDPRDPTSRRAPVAEIASCTRQELPPLATLVPDLNVDLVRFVERMISVDPACRPQTMAEVQQMLVALSGVPELDASGKPIVSPAVRRSRALSMPVAQVTGKLSAASAGGRSAASAGGPRTAVESKSRLVNAAAVLAFLSLPLVLAIWLKFGQESALPVVQHSKVASVAPAHDEQPEEIDELFRLQKWATGYKINISSWSPEPRTAQCPLVFSSLKWQKPPRLELANGVRLDRINGRPVPPHLTGSVRIEASWFADGVNWLEVDNPDHLRVVGTLHFPPMDSPLRCTPRKVPPPEVDYFDVVRYHLLSPDVDGVKAGREFVRKRWPVGDARRVGAELWLSFYTDGLTIGLAEYGNEGSTIFPEPGEALRNPVSLQIARNFLDAQIKVLATEPNRWDAWYGVAFALDLTGHLDSAISAHVRALMLWPESYWSWLDVGSRAADEWDRAYRQNRPADADRYWPLAIHSLRLALKFQQARKNPQALPHVRVAESRLRWLEMKHRHEKIVQQVRPHPARSPRSRPTSLGWESVW